MHVIKFKFKSDLWIIAAIIGFSMIAGGCQKSTQSNQPAAERADAGSAAVPAAESKPDTRPVIVAFGDSLTAGFGLNEEQAYTTLLQRKVDEAGYKYRVINAGVSGDTTAGGLRRIEWAFQGNVKFVILELGGNDALRGLPVSEMKKNLAEIIEVALARGATVILAGMEAPPNMGDEYTVAFRQAYRDLAKKYKLTFIPFVLEGVGGNPQLNQADGIHPNAEGEKILTENIWRTLKPLLK